MVTIGAEYFSDKGLSDKWKMNKIFCFGPSQLASKIECDKAFAKDFMTRHQIPTARYSKFT